MSPLQEKSKTLLAATRELFASTHWGKGEWQGEVPAVTADGVDSYKMFYCFVGGLRHEAGGDPRDAPQEQFVDDDLIAYAEALLAVGKVIAPNKVSAWTYRYYVNDEMVALDMDAALALPFDDDGAPEEALSYLEDLVISWNDDDERVLDDIIGALTKALMEG